MRWALRAAAAVLVVVVVAIAALAVMLPRLAAREDVRDRLAAQAERLLGRPVSFEAIGVALLPPGLVLESPVLAASESDPTSVSAESAELRLALLPLFTGSVVVDAFRADGVLVERPDAAQRPGAPPAPDAPRAGLVVDGRQGRLRVRASGPSLDELRVDVLLDGAEIEQGEWRAAVDARVRVDLVRGPDGAGGTALAPVRVALDDGRASLAGDGLEPIVLEALAGTAEAPSTAEPYAFDFAGRLAAGGELRATGQASAVGDARVDAEIRLDELALAPFGFLLDDSADAGASTAERALAGAVSGAIELHGPTASLESVAADLAVADGVVRIGDIVLRGPLALGARLSGPVDGLAGTFEIDATAAELDYGESFRKPPGTLGRVSGRMEPGPDGGFAFDDVKLEVHNLDARVSARTRPPMRVLVTAPAFELTGWDELVPALAGSRPSGRVRVPRLAATLAPNPGRGGSALDLDGRVVLEGVEMTPSDRGRVRLDGSVVARGSSLETKDLAVSLAGQPTLTVTGRLDDLAGAQRYAMQLSTPRAAVPGPEVNTILSEFTTFTDVLMGPLRLDGRLEGEVGGKSPPLDAARGELALVVGGSDVGGGRMKGVSLLKGVVAQLGPLGDAALAAGKAHGGRDLQKLYDDEFDVIRGTFLLQGGMLRTPDLHMVYDEYTVDLRGVIDLHDRGLDLAGELTLEPSADAAIADRSQGKRRVIPLARVGGTLDAPRVQLSAQAVAQLAASWALGPEREGLEKKIDDALGSEGAGRELLDTLEGVLRR